MSFVIETEDSAARLAILYQHAWPVAAALVLIAAAVAWRKWEERANS